MPQAIITTSWDDGHPLDERIASLLDQNRLTGTFYIPRRIETGVMSDDQIRAIGSRHEIGAHTVNHVFLADAVDDIARQEIAGSKKWVEDLTGKPCPMFCPPAGRFTHRHRPMFREAGFMAIRSVEFLSLDWPRQQDGLLEMPTTLQSFPHPPSSYLRNVAKRRAFRNFLLYTSVGLPRHWPTLARRLLDRAVASGGVFHVWGHSWEIESSDQWVSLQEVLRLLGEYVAANKAQCLTNAQVCQRVRDGAVGAPVIESAAA